MNKSVVGLVAGSMLLTSCAVIQPISSKPRSFDSYGNFKTYDLGPNLFRVTVTGNDFISSDAADELALLEASRSSLARQCRYFVITDQPVRSVTPSAPMRNAQLQIGIGGSWGFGGWGRRAGRFGGWGGSPWGWGTGPWGGNDWGWGTGPWGGPIGPYGIQPQMASTSLTVKCSSSQPPTDSKSAPAFDAYTILRSLGPKYQLDPVTAGIPVEARAASS